MGSTTGTLPAPGTTPESPATSTTVAITQTSEPPPTPPLAEQGVAVVAAGGAELAARPGGRAVVRAREGLTVPVEAGKGTWLSVLTPCDEPAWLRGGTALFAPRAGPAAVGAGFSLDRAVVVLDPGHGGPNRGATGPSGLEEPIVNLDIARRAAELLARSRAVDWETGLVLPGREIPPARSVWLTRTEGPPGADYEAGLLFRAQLANMAGAHALVSVHNNADPDGPFEGPGSEVFYSVKDAGSKRLAGLMIEELRSGFAAFEAEWVGDTDAGAKYRLREDGRTDYYGLLRRAQVAAVLVEGAFITNPSEEELLGTPEFRQAYAEAIYRALVRFLTTDDPGSGFTEPYPRTVPAGSGNPLPTCQVSGQP